MKACAAASYVKGHVSVRLVVQLEPRRTVQYRPATGNLHACTLPCGETLLCGLGVHARPVVSIGAHALTWARAQMQRDAYTHV
jgi:hypothetical protein